VQNSTDRGLDNLLLDLGAQLESAGRRDEEEAATDLAFSLSQDRLLADTLRRGGAVAVLTPGGGRLPVASIGEDFLWTGPHSEQVLRLDYVVLTQADRGEPPAGWSLSFMQILRLLARAGAAVEVQCDTGIVAGQLRASARDFVVIETSSERRLVAHGALRTLRLVKGGLEGVL